VAHINFPVDFQSQAAQERSPRNVPQHTSDVPAYQGGLPPDDDLHMAASILNDGKKIVIYMEFLPKPGKARGVQLDIDPV
jgi:pyruvate dehydrogenase (quinone)